MNVPEPNAEPPLRKRRWLQFSLRALLLFTLVAAIGMSWIAVRIEQIKAQRRAVKKMEDDGWTVDFEPIGPRWLEELVAKTAAEPETPHGPDQDQRNSSGH